MQNLNIQEIGVVNGGCNCECLCRRPHHENGVIVKNIGEKSSMGACETACARLNDECQGLDCE